MSKEALAKLLRKRLIKAGLVPTELVNRVSDDAIIDSYITCSGCHTKIVTSEELVAAVAQARSTEHFFELCDFDARMKNHSAGHN
ncbi:MAG: hypothetical protein WC505_07035 [Patescibacteria group bacterium]